MIEITSWRDFAKGHSKLFSTYCGNGKTGVYKVFLTAIVGFICLGTAYSQTSSGASSPSAPGAFPARTATDARECGSCHQAIYREFQYGFGADMKYPGMVLQSQHEAQMMVPQELRGSSAHAMAGVDPFPIHARDAEESGRSCNVCHYPQAFAIPPLDAPEMVKPTARPKEEEAGGLTCASCHLTPDGKIRTPHQVDAPHPTVLEPAIQTSAMCAYCHAMGKRVVGKQTQTFLEWREDFHNAGLGSQQCQDCHMPRTVRKTAEDFDVPNRVVARHLWTGGHSPQRLGTALSLTMLQSGEGSKRIEFHLINIGAGHSVPTGSNRRGLYLRTQIVSADGSVVATREWLFAPSYGNRPDDRAYLEQDNKRPDAIAASQADSQGPHEATIRAGEERVLTWEPGLKSGSYTVRAELVYDLNRYNDPKFTQDQTTLTNASLSLKVD